MALRSTTQALARASARHPWPVIGAWLAVLVLAGFATARLLAGALTTEFDFTSEPESRRAERLLEERLRGPDRALEFVIVRSESLPVDDPDFRAFVEDLFGRLTALGPQVVEGGATYYLTGDESMVSPGRNVTLIPITMAGTLDEATENVEHVHAIVDDAAAEGLDRGFEVLIGGAATLSEDFNTVAERDIQTGEAIGVPVALVVLVVVFGALVAAFIPILLAMMAIVVALGAVALIGQLFEFSFFVTNMITMMGLAVGIDYSLFVLSRYREERARGLDKYDAIAMAGATSSRAVFFSGMTVVLALLGMLIVPTTIFRSLAGGAILVVLSALLATLTLLPAAMGLLGDRVNSLRVPFVRRALGKGKKGGFWDWATRGVMRRPWTSVAVAAGLLLAAGASLFSLQTGFSGVSTLPDGIRSKEAFLVLEREFSGGLSDPAEIVIDGDVSDPAVQAGAERLQTILAEDPVFGPPAPLQPNETGDLALMSVPFRGDPAGDPATKGVERLRGEYIPQAFQGVDAEVLVGGQTAMGADFFDTTGRYTPIVFVFVLGLSFLLLMVVFRSLVVPVKAILLNLLSVGAAYGLIVLVFQKGVGADLLGFQQVDVIEAWLPLFLFSVLFGLSMDYHVFLLSRIRERYDQTHDNAGSVAFGLRSTAGIITGAALIMVAVFGGFAAGELTSLQQMGFGLAVAVFLDATIVRSVLVPATMELLGDRNWYLPSWLRWLPRVSVEGPEQPVPLPEPGPRREAVTAPRA